MTCRFRRRPFDVGTGNGFRFPVAKEDDMRVMVMVRARSRAPESRLAMPAART